MGDDGTVAVSPGTTYKALSSIHSFKTNTINIDSYPVPEGKAVLILLNRWPDLFNPLQFPYSVYSVLIFGELCHEDCKD